MAKKNNIYHEILVERLCELIRDDYALIQTNVCYPSNSTEIYGQIDLIAFNPGTIDFYEVKGPYNLNNLRKAVKQLRRAREYWQYHGEDFVYTPQKGIERLDDIVREITARKYKKH